MNDEVQFRETSDRFVQSLNHAMQKNNLTINELAQNTGIGSMSISLMLQGKTLPKLTSAIKIARATGMSLDSLL